MEDLGIEKIVSLEIKDHIFKYLADTKYNLRIGDEASFIFAQEKLHFFDRDSGDAIMC